MFLLNRQKLSIVKTYNIIKYNIACSCVNKCNMENNTTGYILDILYGEKFTLTEKLVILRNFSEMHLNYFVQLATVLSLVEDWF